jgi:hypothetical protein
LPEEWPAAGKRRRASDGTEFEWLIRLLDLDPLEQIYTLEARVNRWRNDELIESETRPLRGCLYFRNQIVDMLRLAGFDEITVEGAYTGRKATNEDDDLLYIARRAGE